LIRRQGDIHNRRSCINQGQLNIKIYLRLGTSGAPFDAISAYENVTSCRRV
jgi:hypothetical protein